MALPPAKPLHFLVSAGPTHEPIDPVRFIGNRSSGQMGITLAQTAQARGHHVTLVLGPSHLSAPAGVMVVRVETAQQMLDELEARFAATDVLVMAAAVADVRPVHASAHKLKKEELGATLRLEKNADILAHLGRMRRQQVVVGFSLETLRGAEAIAEAVRKAKAKCCDLMVLNSPGSLGGERAASVVFVKSDGSSEDLGDLSKSELAGRLVAWCELAGSLQ